jgi:hypothetical protein
MKCPRCDGSELEERVRDGITVDRCSGCRGIWLDRGELERLIARAAEDDDRFDDSRSPERDRRDDDRNRWPRGDDDDDRHTWRRDGRGGPWAGRAPYRKKRWFESLSDIFD